MNILNQYDINGNGNIITIIIMNTPGIHDDCYLQTIITTLNNHNKKST